MREDAAQSRLSSDIGLRVLSCLGTAETLIQRSHWHQSTIMIASHSVTNVVQELEKDTWTPDFLLGSSNDRVRCPMRIMYVFSYRA